MPEQVIYIDGATFRRAGEKVKAGHSPQNLSKEELYSLFRFAYFADPDEFYKKFKQAGIEVRNDDDVLMIVELIKSGGDKHGAYKINGSIPVYFSGMDIFNNIEISEKEATEAVLNRIKFA